MFNEFVRCVRDIYGTNDFISLHEPRFIGNEKKYLLETIDSTFVSSVGAFVDQFEDKVQEFTKAAYTVATVNGTSALHIALILAGMEPGDEVITQSLTFVATCNAIRYCNAKPVFIDVDIATMGLSPDSLEEFLENNCELRSDGFCWNRRTGCIVRACVPMHTFGFPARLDELKQICDLHNIMLIEDAAESLGSTYRGQHTGTIGDIAAVSFNGNKIITTGGGGMLLIKDKKLAIRAKHLTTTAKVPHKWDFEHDQIGFNYRMPNLNAALGVAQMESLLNYIESKRAIAERYHLWGEKHGVQFVRELTETRANYWLNAVITNNKFERDEFLETTNNKGIMTRPAWRPMHKLLFNQDCTRGDLTNTEWLYERLVNVPSSVMIRS